MEPVVPKHIDDLIGFDTNNGRNQLSVDKSKQNKEETELARQEIARVNEKDKNDTSAHSNIHSKPLKVATTSGDY